MNNEDFRPYVLGLAGQHNEDETQINLKRVKFFLDERDSWAEKAKVEFPNKWQDILNELNILMEKHS